MEPGQGSEQHLEMILERSPMLLMVMKIVMKTGFCASRLRMWTFFNKKQSREKENDAGKLRKLRRLSVFIN